VRKGVFLIKKGAFLTGVSSFIAEEQRVWYGRFIKNVCAYKMIRIRYRIK